MNTVVAVHTGVVDEDTPLLTADDYGLTRGDGCFDATRVTMVDGRPHAAHLDRHLERFARSAAAMSIELDLQAVSSIIDEALATWDGPEATLKMMVTRGREYTSSEPTIVVTISPFPRSQIDQRRGLSLASLSRGTHSRSFQDAPWLLGGVKHLSYAVNMAAKREAAARGADDALFVTTDGYALEGPNAALIWLRDGELATTSLDGTGILASVTQATAFEAAEADGVGTRFDLISLADLLTCDSVWLASSIRGITPVTSIDGQELAVDRDWTNRLNGWAGFPLLTD